MSSSNRCCVPGCTSRTQLFNFPTNDIFGLQWVEAINNPLLNQLQYSDISKRRYRVCALHFSRNQIWQTKQKLILHKGVVPSFNLPSMDNVLTANSEITLANAPNQSTTTPSTLPPNTPSTHSILNTPTCSTPRSRIPHSTHSILNTPTCSTPTSNISATTPNASSKRKAEDIEAQKLKRSRNYYRKKAQELREELKVGIDTKFHSDVLDLSDAEQTIVCMLLKNANKGIHGHRFTNEEKLLCLAIYKKSPSAYRYLRSLLSLPSEKTLRNILYKIDLDCGFTETMKRYLKTLAQKMKTKEKVCVLMWDKMSISPHLQYCKKRDKVVGFHDFSGRRIMAFATQALVFMIKGVNFNWKLPLCYYFSHSSTGNTQLMECITEVVIAIQEAGFDVVASVCDQSKANMAAIRGLSLVSNDNEKEMGEDEGISYVINEKEIVHLYDIPHIFKCIRNNFIKKPFIMNSKDKLIVGSWQHIIEAYNAYITVDPTYAGAEFGKLFTLNKNHVYPPQEKRMKVKLAMQVFSDSCSELIYYLLSFNVISKDCRDTSVLLKFFNQIIDFCNGSPNDKSSKRCAWTGDSYHNTSYEELMKRLDTINFLGEDSHNRSPALDNLKQTLKGLKFLFKSLQKLGINKIYTRDFNQDPVENFFGQIWAHG